MNIDGIRRALLALVTTIAVLATAPSAMAVAGGQLEFYGTTAPDFGDQAVAAGATATMNAVVKNTGSSSVTINSGYFLYASGGNPGDFPVVSDGCRNKTLAANEECIVTIAFNPSATGTRSTTFDVAAYGTGSWGANRYWSPHGTGTDPTMSPSASTIAFANQRADGSVPETKTVTITNSGTTGSLMFYDSITGVDASAYTLPGSGSCGASSTKTLGPGASCTIAVTFDPPQVASYSAAALHLTDNSGTGAHDIALTGSGVSSVLSVSPASVGFGEVRVKPAVASGQNVTITNTSGSALQLSSIGVVSGDTESFGVTFLGCTTLFPSVGMKSLAAGASCVAVPNFNPQSTGALAAVLRITGADGNVTDVPLGGTGVAPAVGTSASSLAFGDQRTDAGASTARSITVTNTGTAALAWTSASIVGADASAFAITSPDCASTIVVAATCTIDVTFDPTEARAYAATLRLTHDADGSPTDIALSGTGTVATTGAGTGTGTGSGDGAGAVTKPAAARAPLIRGARNVGKTLACAGATWTGTAPFTITYRWQRKTGKRWVAIRGATKAARTVASADAGHRLRCMVTAKNSAGSATATSAAALIPVPVVRR